jgi:hypothetical protein
MKSPKRARRHSGLQCAISDTEKSLTDVLAALEKRDEAGFFRVVQTQRMIWAEKSNGKLRLRKWHAGTREVLSRTAAAFERDRGRWPQ